jgi:hypothetical protein
MTKMSLIPKPDKDIYNKNKITGNVPDEKRYKILNKILANQIQQHIKRTIYYEQVGFILGTLSICNR